LLRFYVQNEPPKLKRRKLTSESLVKIGAVYLLLIMLGCGRGTHTNDASFDNDCGTSRHERGEFDKAVEHQQQAIDLAPDKQEKGFRSRLELYKSGAPYRSMN
jgi:hypothetical protein